MPAQPHLVVAGQRRVQLAQRRLDPVLQVGHEGAGVLGEIKARVVGRALGLEVLRQILVRVAVAVGADDPDLLGPQPLAQLAERAQLETDAVRAPGLVDDRFAPLRRDHLGWHVVGRNVAGGAVALAHDPVERVELPGRQAALFERSPSTASNGCSIRR